MIFWRKIFQSKSKRSFLPLVASILLIILLFTLLLPLHPALASERDVIKKEKSLEDVKKQIRAGKETVKKIEGRERSILDDLQAILKSLVGIRSELKRSEKELKKVEEEIGGVERKLADLKAESVILRKRLDKRLRSMHLMRRGAGLGVIFSAASSEDLGRRHKLMSIIMDSDRQLIEECERNLAEVKIERDRLALLKGKHEKVLLAHRGKQRSADKKRRERAKLLKRTKSERAQQERLVKELEGAARELSTLIESLKKKASTSSLDSTGFAAMRGRLTRPVEGKVVQEYGKVKHPKFNTITFNNGVIIGAPLGRTVKSVYNGKVAYVGWLKGYGQVLIIEHGGGFYTLFGQLFKILKNRGDTVVMGEEVGLVGDSGLDETPGLYFEVREGGVPRDPMAWFSAR